MKVVLDTNLLVASYWNEISSSRKIINLAKKGYMRVVWSKNIRNEAEFILKRIKVNNEFFKLVQSIYLPENEVFPKKKISVVSDYADNRLLEAADEGQADYLVTSDRGLLEVKTFGKTRVLKPSAFLSKYPKA